MSLDGYVWKRCERCRNYYYILEDCGLCSDCYEDLFAPEEPLVDRRTSERIVAKMEGVDDE